MRSQSRWRRTLRDIRLFFHEINLSPFPLGKELSGYNGQKAWSDLRAALNVALVAFPQGMAYAMIAGLPIQYGIYCSAVAPMVAACWAGSRYTVVGPTNATAIMVLSAFLGMPENVDKLASMNLLVLMVGFFLMAGALLKGASLTQYISRSVIVGYITGAAILNIANQVHHTLGFPLENASTFYDMCCQTLERLFETQSPTLALSLGTMMVWLVCNHWMKTLPNVAITLAVMSGVVWLAEKRGYSFAMLHSIHPEDWRFTIPQVGSSGLGQLAWPALAIAFVAMIENTSMSKSLASRTGNDTNLNQEMLGLGASNVAASFLGCMPASGSPIRSVINWKSGAITPLSSLYSGLLCAIGVLLFGKWIAYVPLASLAVVIIGVAVSLIDLPRIRMIFHATRSDALVLITTFVAALLTPLHFAIFLGVGLSVVLFLQKAGAPQLVEYTFNEEGHLCEVGQGRERENARISIIHAEGNLFFGAADLFRDAIRRICHSSEIRVVILRLKNAHHLDASGVMALEELILYLRETGRHLLISGAMRDVLRVLRDSGLIDLLGRENFFMASGGNPNVSTRNALKRAQELLGTQQDSVRIFYDSHHQTGKS